MARSVQPVFPRLIPKSERAEGMTARAKKQEFDCVAFQRAQREKLGKKLETMSSEETGTWMRDYRPTDPKLRRLVERLLDRTASVPEPPSSEHRLPA